MALIDSGIEKVRAFDLSAGIREDGSFFSLPRVVLVKWRSSWSDKLYQVYVNGKYAGLTLDVEQRKMVVQLPSSPEGPVKIEVFAVSFEEANIDFSSELVSQMKDSGRVKIVLLRSQNLPAGSVAQIYFDNGTGEIDYENPLNDSPIRLWPVWQDKAGLGQSKYGFSDFGYDSAAAIGFGKGSFGYGQFGLDADTIEWVSRQMPTGVYRFAVKVISENGNESSVSETGDVAVTLAAKPPEGLNVSSFDKQTDQLVLAVG